MEIEDRDEGPPRKRLLTDLKTIITASTESTVSSDSSSDRFAKKTRELPNLSDCHSCGVRINYTNPKERLQPLDSMWRVVLLCRKCIKRVKSSDLCPYCFTSVIDEKDCFRCRDCQHSIHKDCVAKHSSGLGLGFSVCVDCWVPDAVANSIRATKRKSRKKNTESATLPESRASVQETNISGEVENMAAAGKASENALRKTVVAKNAVELAKDVLIAGKFPTKVVNDGELAFISRYACLLSSCRGKNVPMMCYSRRCAKKKTSLMNSSSLDMPLICYSRRNQKGSMRNSVCYFRRHSNIGDSNFYSRNVYKLSEGIDKQVSVSSAGFNGETSLDGRKGQESEDERFGKEHDRYLLKYQRIGKGTPRTSVFTKDPDCGSCMDSANLSKEAMSGSKSCGNGNECHENIEMCNDRFLLKYKRSRPKSNCKVTEFSSNYPLESTSVPDTRF